MLLLIISLSVIFGLLSNAVLSELYQKELVTEDEVQMMNNQDRHLSDSVLIFQCTKPPELVTRTVIVLDKYIYNDAARQLRG